MQNLPETNRPSKFPMPKAVVEPDVENSFLKFIEQLPPKSNLILHEQTWEDYEFSLRRRAKPAVYAFLSIQELWKLRLFQPNTKIMLV